MLYMKNTSFFMRTSLFVTVLAIGSYVFSCQAYAQRKATKAERVSQSRPPESYGTDRSSAPKSNSQEVRSRSSSRSRPRSGTKIPFIMNVPRDPLRPSDRARFYGIGAIEIGLNAGTTHVFSDVGGKPGSDHWNAGAFLGENISYSAGLFSRYKINEWFGLALGVDHAKLTASNANGFNYNYRSGENHFTETIYSFSNKVYEVSWKMELHTPPFRKSGVGLYGFAGISGIYNNPEMYDANSQLIIPNTDQQNNPSPYSLALPLGGGVTIVVANYVRVGLEVGYRYTANHGLDGAFVTDTRYDSFLYNTIRIGYVLPQKK
jgi:hypothetical protein